MKKKTAAKAPRIPAKLGDIEAIKVANILHLRDLHREAEESRKARTREDSGDSEKSPTLFRT
jgi:hypothetical protein